MSLIGIAFALYENRRHFGESGLPWPTIWGIIVLGIIGPALSWICIKWAIGAANAYMASQQKLHQRAEELATLNRLHIASIRESNLEKTIVSSLEQTMEALDANAGMVFIQHDSQPGLRLEAHRGISVTMAEKEAQLSPGHCLCGQAVESREILFARDVGDDVRCTSSLCICEGFRAVACAPLEVKGQLVGLLQLASCEVGHFTDDSRDFLAATAAHVSVSIENARLYDQVRTFNVELEQKINERTGELEAARWSLAEKARQLQRLLNESYRIQESTKARIAQDMHDGVTQLVIGALYETQAAKEALSNDPQLADENLTRTVKLLAEMDAEIRRVIYDLHPPVLDMMGLVQALKQYSSTFTDTFGIECKVRVVGSSRRLHKDVEVAFYRVIQAALQNVATHAHASQVIVTFDYSPVSLTVTIGDNGVGFDPVMEMATPGEHLGLIGMNERAEAIGADLKIVSFQGQGARIELHLPSPS
jgi:signal transduction histidine kinase